MKKSSATIGRFFITRIQLLTIVLLVQFIALGVILYLSKPEVLPFDLYRGIIVGGLLLTMGIAFYRGILENLLFMTEWRENVQRINKIISSLFLMSFYIACVVVGWIVYLRLINLEDLITNSVMMIVMFSFFYLLVGTVAVLFTTMTVTYVTKFFLGYKKDRILAILILFVFVIMGGVILFVLQI